MSIFLGISVCANSSSSLWLMGSSYLGYTLLCQLFEVQVLLLEYIQRWQAHKWWKARCFFPLRILIKLKTPSSLQRHLKEVAPLSGPSVLSPPYEIGRLHSHTNFFHGFLGIRNARCNNAALLSAIPQIIFEDKDLLLSGPHPRCSQDAHLAKKGEIPIPVDFTKTQKNPRSPFYLLTQ